MPYFETSAMENNCVDDIFEHVVAMTEQMDKSIVPQSIQVLPPQPPIPSQPIKPPQQTSGYFNLFHNAFNYIFTNISFIDF